MKEIVISRAMVKMPRNKNEIPIRYEIELVKAENCFIVKRYLYKSNELSGYNVLAYTVSKELAIGEFNKIINDLTSVL